MYKKFILPCLHTLFPGLRESRGSRRYTICSTDSIFLGLTDMVREITVKIIFENDIFFVNVNLNMCSAHFYIVSR